MSVSVDFTAQVTSMRDSSRLLGATSGEVRNAVLNSFARLIREAVPAIVEANDQDIARAIDAGVSGALLDRLKLDSDRIVELANAVDAVAELPDPLAEILEQRTLDNGLELEKRRVPFGVVCVVYEARPGVTADAAAIAIKTGNSIVLRGSRQAVASNKLLAELAQSALAEHGLPRDLVWCFPPEDRDGFKQLIAVDSLLDLVIPRGGEGLKAFLFEHARVPVLAAAGGNCHIFVDASADLEMAKAIVLNAKTQRPGVCNAAETLLIHEDRAGEMLPELLAELEHAGVRINRDPDAFDLEFLDLEIAVGIVADVDQAIQHINEHGTGHSEAIITSDTENAKRFTEGVDAAAVYVNASTRFTDGGVFGLGTEVGISTNKLHARGPIGLRELTTTKYVLTGDGHVRT